MRSQSDGPRDRTVDTRSDRTLPDRVQPSWGSVLISVGLLAAFPLALWVLPAPLNRLAILGGIATTTVVLVAGGRRAHSLVRCFQECRAMVFDIGDTIHVTVSRSPACETCCGT